MDRINESGLRAGRICSACATFRMRQSHPSLSHQSKCGTTLTLRYFSSGVMYRFVSSLSTARVSIFIKTWTSAISPDEGMWVSTSISGRIPHAEPNFCAEN